MFAQEETTASSLEGVSALIESVLSNILSIPVVLLVLAILFRQPIRNILSEFYQKLKKGKLSGFEAGTSGVKFSFDTTLGSIDASIGPSAFDRKNLATYENGQYGFRISWDNLVYKDDRAVAKQMEKHFNYVVSFPFFLIRRNKIDGFSPNINVNVEAIGHDVSTKQYVHSGVATLKKIGYDVSNIRVDSVSAIGYYEIGIAENYYMFAKVSVNDGLAYTVTASLQPPMETTQLPIEAEQHPTISATQAQNAFKALRKQTIRQELQSILNSFELIKNS